MKQQVKELLKKYKEGTCTIEEQKRLEEYFDRYVLESKDWPSPEALEILSARLEDIVPRAREKTRRNTLLRNMYRYAAVACIFLGLGLAIYVLLPEVAPNLFLKDYNPIGNKATLTLADGTQLDLDKLELTDKGLEVGGLLLHKNVDGSVGYHIKGKDNSTMEAHTFKTPKGGTYRIALPDGSQVWLNGDSELTILSDFDIDQRMVQFEGEAYFDIAHRIDKPFVVVSAGQQIRVLGTEFNLNTYSPVLQRTTLVSGKLVVRTDAGNSQILKPGEQALVDNASLHIRGVDIELETAWRDGVFMLKDTPIREAMDEISRWYGVEVDMESLPNDRFSAVIPRDRSLRQVLNMLEATSNLKFKIEGGRVRMER